MNSIVSCPHCGQVIEILELNCRIFRCGIYKDSFQQIDPHLCKELCDSLAKQQKIFGCGKPFQLVDGKDSSGNPIFVSHQCGYI